MYMEYIANNHIRLPLLGLGTFSMHNDMLRRVVKDAISLGYSLFDTATKYENEKELGLSLKDTSNVYIQSKVHALQLLGDKKLFRLDRKSVRKSYSLSCERLGVSPYVYLLHSPFVGYERFLEDLLTLRENGRIEGVGVCNLNFDQLVRLVSVGLKPDIIQIEIHPYHNQQRLINYCHSQGILVEARSPLAHGDALQEWLSSGVLQKISKRYSKTIPQVILRWITQQKVIAIVRASKPDHIKDDMESFNFDLTENDMNDIYSLNKNQSFGLISSKR